MKHLFPKVPILAVLNIQQDKNNSTDTKLLIFSPLTKEQCDKFSSELTHYLTFHKTNGKRTELNSALKKLHNFTFADIIAIGGTDIENRLASSYIESNTLRFDTVTRRNYKCFINKDWKDPQNKMNLPYHDDGGCAWNCLMHKLSNPKYGIIFSIPTEDKYKFKLDE